MEIKPPMVVVGDEWGLHPTSVQHLTRRLVRNRPVLYANTFCHRRPSWSIDDTARALAKLRLWFSSSGHNHNMVSSNLHFCSPASIPFLPVGPIRRWNRHQLVERLSEQMKVNNINNPILFVALPFGAEAIGRLGEQLLIYYVMDQYSAMPNVYADYIDELENTILSRADLIFVTSRNLVQEKNGSKTSAVLLPHGVDFEHFHSAVQPLGDVPEELRNLPRPILGFHGVLAPWVDTEILENLCRAFPQGSIVLIGPEWIDFQLSKRWPNLHRLGMRSYAELPRYAAHFDVGLIPFRQDRLTAYVNPLKLLEYLALGLPVVSTPLPDLAAYAKVVYQARTPDDFVDQVNLALNDRDPMRRKERFGLAAEESWEARVNTLEGHIDNALRERRCS
jgi:glycosyltransferase involved in cell wall biosynthesis